MRKSIYYFFILISSLSCFSNKEIPIKEPIEPILSFDNRSRYIYEDFPTNEKNISNQLYIQIFKEPSQRFSRIINGKKEGMWLSGNADFDDKGNVYAKGKIWKEEHFKNDLRNGVFKQYDNNGNIIYETVFKNGTGLWKEFHSNGQLYFEIYTKNGYFTDTLRLYDDKGTLIGKRLYIKDSLVYSSGLPCFPYRSSSRISE